VVGVRDRTGNGEPPAGHPPAGAPPVPSPSSPVPANPVVAPPAPVADQAGSGGAGAAGDAAIVARARADLRAFAPLYDRHYDGIFGFCLRRLGDREAAADATHHVFHRAMTRLDQWQGGSFAAWLYAIARTVVIDLARAHRPTLSLDPAQADARPDTDPPPDAQVIRAERQRRLLAAMARLTPDQRAVVELRLAGLSGPEVAAALGMTTGAAQSCQFRAYRSLRRLLAADPAFDLPGDLPADHAAHPGASTAVPSTGDQP
jgi:RNA polymerase sigma factor (sigma-70 family)